MYEIFSTIPSITWTHYIGLLCKITWPCED